MKNSHKFKLYRLVLKILNSNIFYYILILLLVYILYGTIIVDELNPNDFLNVGLLASLLLAFITTTISKKLANFFNRKLEDHDKLDTNYDTLLSKYPKGTNMIEYENTDSSNYIKGRKKTNCKRKSNADSDKEETNKDKYIFPVVLVEYCNSYKFDVKDSKEQYVLPDIIRDNYDNIMEAHRYSKVYNKLCVRLDNYHIEKDKKIILHTSRTTYYKSLVTNRAMDYRWSPNNSVRDLYSPGPFLEELSESKLSNHLGYNGLVETSDGKIIFIHRSKDVSIGKDTLGTSVGASLKTEYALDDEGCLTSDGLEKAITSEMLDELKIKKKYYKFSLNKNIVAIYRDIVEGGKPQLLFYVRLNISSDEVKKKFYKSVKSSKKDKNNMTVDGKKLIFVDKNELDNIYITPDIMVIGRKKYRTMPSTAASVVMIIEQMPTL